MSLADSLGSSASDPPLRRPPSCEGSRELPTSCGRCPPCPTTWLNLSPRSALANAHRARALAALDALSRRVREPDTAFAKEYGEAAPRRRPSSAAPDANGPGRSWYRRLCAYASTRRSATTGAQPTSRRTRLTASPSPTRPPSARRASDSSALRDRPARGDPMPRRLPAFFFRRRTSGLPAGMPAASSRSSRVASRHASSAARHGATEDRVA
jgi:hypothetical protein